MKFKEFLTGSPYYVYLNRIHSDSYSPNKPNQLLFLAIKIGINFTHLIPIFIGLTTI